MINVFLKFIFTMMFLLVISSTFNAQNDFTVISSTDASRDLLKPIKAGKSTSFTVTVKNNLSNYAIVSIDTFQMPASVMLSPSDTLYKIPKLYFQNFRNSGYFPLMVHSEFKVKVSYSYATEEQKIYNLCTNDINQADFNNAHQVIIKSATKY